MGEGEGLRWPLTKMLRQLGGEPECERKDNMRMQVDQLPGIPKHCQA